MGELAIALLLLLEDKTAVTKQDALDEDVLDRGEFTKRMLALAAALVLVLRRQETAAADRVARLLDRDWTTMAARQRGAVLRQAARELQQIPKGVEGRLQRRAVEAALVMDRRARMAARRQQNLDVRPAPTSAQQAKAGRFASPTPEFVAQEYQRRGVAFAGSAAVAIGVGLRLGESGAEITARVQQRATAALGRDAYLQGVAGAVLNRARTNSLLTVYREAGTTNIQVLSARDERTCFPAGTQILLPHGSHKSIEDIEVGDEVITRLGRPRKVLTTFRKQAEAWARIEFANGEIVYSTIDHEFATDDGGWKRADQLRGCWVESMGTKSDVALRLVREGFRSLSQFCSPAEKLLDEVRTAVAPETVSATKSHLTLRFVPKEIQSQGQHGKSIEELLMEVQDVGTHRQEVCAMRQAHVGQAVPKRPATILLGEVLSASVPDRVSDVRTQIQNHSCQEEEGEVLFLSMLSPPRTANVDRVGSRPRAPIRANQIHWRGRSRSMGRGLPGSGLPNRGGRRRLLACQGVEKAPRSAKGCRSEEVGIHGSQIDRDRGSCRSTEHPSLDFGSVEVVAVTIEYRGAPAYDIEVEEDHSYVVGSGFVVHNCEKCLWMHGTVFPVPQTFDLMDRVSRLRSPAAISRVNPFLREGVSANGDRVIYTPGTDGARLVLATVFESRQGQVDRLSTFDRTPNPIDLLSLGIGLPPYHPICRCVPVIA